MFNKMSDLEKISNLITISIIAIVAYDVIYFNINDKVAFDVNTMSNYIIALLALLILSLFVLMLETIDEFNKRKKIKK